MGCSPSRHRQQQYSQETRESNESALIETMEDENPVQSACANKNHYGSIDTSTTTSTKDDNSKNEEQQISLRHFRNSPIDPGMFVTQQKISLSDKFVKEKKLGSGAYGEVIQCRDKQSGAVRAIKIIKKTMVNATVGALLDEVALVKQLDHPNIMKLYEFFEDKRSFYLVMDVYEGGELFDEIISRQKFTEVDAAVTIKQVLSGTTYLHKNHIVHRDLKPENLLLESKSPDALIKIVDFGLSAIIDATKKLKERLGTAYYIAPEVLRETYDEKCDVWSIGVILYILLCGYPPFGGATDKEILSRVERGKYKFDAKDWESISPDAKDLIARMLCLDVTRRITAEEALGHSWIHHMANREKTAMYIEDHQLLSALGNMRRFQASQRLAQAALLFMGSKLTTLEETKELTKIFRSLDVNGDGQLDRTELIQGIGMLTKLKGDEDTLMTKEEIEEEVDKILESVDFDRNGFVEYSEFVTVAMDRKTLLSRDRLKAAFNLFDQDESGTIAADELRRILVEVDDQQWEVIIREVDTNHDGEVDFDEFTAMMQRLCIDSEVARKIRDQEEQTTISYKM